MKRKFVALIVVLFSCAAIGLIFIQIYQTQRAMKATDSLFGISVSNTMDVVVPNLEGISASAFIFDNLDSIICEELLVNGISNEPDVAIVRTNLNEFLYCSLPGKEQEFRMSPYKFTFHPSFVNEDLFLILSFPKSPWGIQHDSSYFSIAYILLIIVVVVIFVIAMITILKQRKLDEMKSDFISNMTHEIKTPLATISLASQMLRDPTISTDATQQETFLNMINDESSRLRVLVETILQSSKMSSKNYSIHLGEVDMHPLIQQAALSFRLTLQNRGGNLNLKLDAKESLVFADQLHMSNLVHNLIDNAIKYSDKAPEIEISTTTEDGMFVMKVKDHGIGIDRQDQRHIFDKFYRVSTGNVHNVKGFGIGLNYVAKVVALHHGTITVDSELGEGSTFSVSLPL